MLPHLPILTVVLPLVCAPLCLLFARSDTLVRVTALAANFISLVFASIMLVHTGTGGVMDYAIGGWDAPWGIAFRVDRMSALVVFLFALISTAAVLYMHKSLACELKRVRPYAIYSVTLVSQAGFFGIALTDDLFNIFVLLEMASLSGYAMAAASATRGALLCAYRYLIMGTIGALFFLLGIGYLYLLTGTLNLSDLAVRLPQVEAANALAAAYAFIGIGLFLKMALFPLHLWLPGVYTHAPSAVAALFAGTAGKAAIYLFVRLFFSTFGASNVPSAMLDILTLLAIAALLAGSVKALLDDNAKTVMAYSSIVNVGYIMLAVALANRSGLAAALMHVFNHAIIKCALFMSLGCIACRVGGCRLADLAGLARRMPWTCAALTAGGIALIGVPTTAGFVSKWYLVTAAFDAQLWIAAALILTASLVSVAYVWRLVEALYLKPAAQPAGTGKPPGEAPFMMLSSCWFLTVFNFYIGLSPSWLVNLCSGIAGELL